MKDEACVQRVLQKGNNFKRCEFKNKLRREDRKRNDDEDGGANEVKIKVEP